MREEEEEEDEPASKDIEQAEMIAHHMQIVPGLVSGVAQAAVMSPADRALYLSVTNRRPFLTPANWATPYQGFGQAISHRTLAGSVYYILQDEMIALFTPILGLLSLNSFLATRVCRC